jgi:hypothetical protein
MLAVQHPALPANDGVVINAGVFSDSYLASD